MGGSIKAIEKGFFQSEIRQNAYRLKKEADAGDRVIVGVNKYSEIEEKSKERLGSLNESLEAFINLQEMHSQKITDFKKIETEFNSSNLSANQSLAEARTKMKDILRRLSLYESDKCPTCESLLDTDFHSNVKNGLEVESKKMESNLSEIESLILDLRKKEADEFYLSIQSAALSEEDRLNT